MTKLNETEQGLAEAVEVWAENEKIKLTAEQFKYLWTELSYMDKYADPDSSWDKIDRDIWEIWRSMND